MNPLIQQLFERIEATSGQPREDHLLALSMILEKNFSSKKSDPAWRMFIPDDIFNVQLTASDRLEIVSKVDSYLAGYLLSQREKISCISALGTMANFLPALEAILRFLQRTHSTLTDAEAYAVLAMLHVSSLSRETRQAARELVDRYNTGPSIEELALRADRSLRELAQRTLRALATLNRGESSQADASQSNSVAEDNPLIAQAFDDQRRFIELLQKLTAAGKLEWARSEQEPGFVFCLAGDELILFELRGGENAAPVEPEGKVAGIVSKCRNVTYLWLEGLHEWDKLLALLKQAPIDNRKLIEIRRRSHESPIHALERMHRE